MNEVEKMYKNAGIEPVLFYDCESYNQKVEKGYLFTSEKQLELIKWLASYGKYDQDRRLLLECFDGEWYIAFYEDIDLISNGSEVDFKECLAKVINKLWQDLTDTDKAEIKNILESEVSE